MFEVDVCERTEMCGRVNQGCLSERSLKVSIWKLTERRGYDQSSKPLRRRGKGNQGFRCLGRAFAASPTFRILASLSRKGEVSVHRELRTRVQSGESNGGEDKNDTPPEARPRHCCGDTRSHCRHGEESIRRLFQMTLKLDNHQIG